MIFDLSSPGRKTVVRIVYGTLALLFFVGFVGFGIGGELGSGGIFDGLTGGSDSSTASQYEQQIEDAESKLETDPENPAALVDLARYRYLSGQSQLEQDEQTLQVSLTEESRQEFEAAVAAWDDYLATDPKKPDVATAGNMVQAYIFLADAEGAAEAQEIVADANPSGAQYLRLATYRYADFDFKGGDQAADQARKAAKPEELKPLEKQLDQAREFAQKQQKLAEKQGGDTAAGEQALESPFGGLGGESAAPAAP